METNGLTWRDYEKMKRLAADIFRDYDIHSFPIDPFDVCKKMGIRVIPYSSLGPKTALLFEKIFSQDAFSKFFWDESKFVVFYNDQAPNVRIRFSISHEIKHYVNGDFVKEKTDVKDEKAADYFASYFLAPTPICYLIGVRDVYDIMDFFHVSEPCASRRIYELRNWINRFKEGKLEDYEKQIMKQFAI